jgi:protein O-GlcNAc transferase
MPTSTDSPRDAEGWYRLGNACGQRGEHQRAAVCFANALALRPQTPEIVRNLGATLQILGRTGEALECYRRFLQEAPGTAEIYYNLGNALADTGAFAEAVSAYRKALALAPRWADAQVNLGLALDAAGDLDGAAEQYEAAGAERLLANAMADQGRTEEAAAAYARAGMALQSALLLPVIAGSEQEVHAWRARFAQGIDQLGSPRIEDPVREGGATGFYLSYHGLPNRELLSKLAAFYQRACPALSWTAGLRKRSGRIRVGFISRYLHDHSIGKTSRGLIAKLSRERFETVTLFVSPLRDDETSRFIRANSERFVVLPADLAAARRAIAELQLDVLFYQDIGMEPFTYFLAFSRLAPVQCVSFGHPDTTGIPTIDYFVSNDLFEPDDAQQHYSERLFLLRNLGTLAYYHRPQAPGGKTFDLTGTLYLCPQALFKLHPSFDPMLGEILRSDRSGRLVLLEGRSGHWRRQLQARFERSFPDVADRVQFLPRQSGSDFTSLVAACDVMLDTPHFNGMNTSLEAFAVGTPVVTLPSGLQRGRHTSGMYRRMGFSECVAKNDDDYVRLALRLGRDAQYRQSVAEQIRQRSGVLFEDPQVVREFERFFTEVVR